MQISVVIPLFNEQQSLTELYTWIKAALKKENKTYELIFIDDGSTDGSWEVVRSLSEKDNCVKGIRFSANFGKSQDLHIGFEEALGEVVITMDADLQDSPDEIPEFYRLITVENRDMVSGWKKKRYDSYLSKNLPSKIFNWAARKASGLKLHDFNCGIKAYKKEVVKNINVGGDMHRYIPVLVKNAGYRNIVEKVVQHQARKYGQTKFGRGRFIRGFLDLITIWFISRFAKDPMHFFGALGLLMFFLGFLLTLYLGVEKVFIHTKGRLLTERPEFYVALASMIIGAQLFLTGFLAEMIIRSKNSKTRYRISEKV